MDSYFGGLTSHTVGCVLKDITRRAMSEIWRRRVNFVSHNKTVDYKVNPEDKVTDADFASQEVMIRKLTECFPEYGIIAEEHGFTRESQRNGLFFAIDPMDGTKAFDRRQSTGFGPMLALCDSKSVLSAFVGDAMTNELYYFRPGSERVHRLNFLDGQSETLSIDPKRTLVSQYLLSREHPATAPFIYGQLALPNSMRGLFQNVEVSGGGIGIGCARLWKGEVGGYLIKAGKFSPWDMLPVWGISKKLGFQWLEYTFEVPNGVLGVDRKKWIPIEVTPSYDFSTFDNWLLVIHESRIEELNQWTLRNWI